MGLDVRLPIGLLFAAIGLALCVFGAVSDESLYQKSLGINVNLVWGVVLLVFGGIMLLLGWGARSAPHSDSNSDSRRERSVGR